MVPQTRSKERSRRDGQRLRRLTLLGGLAGALLLNGSVVVWSGSKVRRLERIGHRGLLLAGQGRDDGGWEDSAAGRGTVNVADTGGAVAEGRHRPKAIIPAAVIVPLATHQGKEMDKIRDDTKSGDLDEKVNRKDKKRADADRARLAYLSKSDTKYFAAEVARLAQIEKMKLNFPPLESILDNKTSVKYEDEKNIIGDVSFLLDVAILGHAKTATSFLAKWFADHPNVAIWEDEVCTLYKYQPAGLARRLYNDFPQSNVTTHRGFKCPGHFSYPYLRYFRRYFTNARLIVGVRHPVRWFESFYNFLSRKGHEMPKPRSLIGSCGNGDYKGFCTDQAAFHQNLAKFGKTNLRDPAEMALLRLPANKSRGIRRTDNPIFLYEMSQIHDNNHTRLDQFKADLQRFLRLPIPLPDASDAAKKTTSSRAKAKVLNICLDEHRAVRDELIDIGVRAGTWIRQYFMRLDPSEVTISNREFFERALIEWRHDPCRAANASASNGQGLSQVFKTKST